MSVTNKWLLLLDLDGTLWDNEDISLLKPPFKKVSEDTIIDSNGVEVRLNHDILRLARWAKENGGITSTLSWNIPDNAIAALQAFQIINMFDYVTIENTHRKDKMIIKLLKRIKIEKNVEFKPCKIVYIDDRDIHIRDIYSNVGPVNFLQAWVDFDNFEEAVQLIITALEKCI
jgi:magnesium-dependent phosphatase-1